MARNAWLAVFAGSNSKTIMAEKGRAESDYFVFVLRLNMIPSYVLSYDTWSGNANGGRESLVMICHLPFAICVELLVKVTMIQD